MNRSANTVSRVIRDAGDRITLQSMTKHNQAHASYAHVSSIGHIKEDELRGTLDHTSAMNGFAIQLRKPAQCGDIKALKYIW